MRLGVRDAFATLFVAIGVLAALSVTQGWNWPLMNGVRMGIIALGVSGMVACAVSGWGTDVADRRVSWTSPFILVGMLLGVVVVAAAIIGLLADAAVWLTVMIAGVVGLWLVTSIDRLFAGPAGRPVTAA